MPNRIIKESICTSDTLDQLSAEEERLFYRLLVQADDFGRFDARPAVVLAACFPLRAHQMDVEQVEAWLQALEKANLIQFYYVGGRRYLQFTTWEKHQQRRAKYSKYPNPPSRVSDMQSSDIICNHVQSDASNCPRETRHENREYENRESRTDTHAHARTREEVADTPPPVCVSVGESVEDADLCSDSLVLVLDAYRRHIGVLGGTQIEKLRYWLEDMGLPAEVIIEAIEAAAEADKRRFGYLEGILRNWHNDGIRTVEQAREARRPRQSARADPSGAVSLADILDRAVQNVLAREGQR